MALKNLPEEVTNDDHITLNWTEPKSNGAPIAHYTPYYRTMTRGSKPAKWAKIKHTTQLLERVEVVRGKINEFVVTATNSCGESDKENIKSVNVLGKLQFTPFLVVRVHYYFRSGAVAQ